MTEAALSERPVEFYFRRDIMNASKILIVESLPSTARSYQTRLKRLGIEADISVSVSDVIKTLQTGLYDVVLIEDEHSKIGGLNLINQMKTLVHGVQYILIAAEASMKDAISAVRDGAYDFVIKPFSDQRILSSINGAKLLNSQRVSRGFRETPEPLPAELGFIGRSVAIQLVKKMIKTFGNSSSSVFLTGQSGTGKEVSARAIHKVSDRRSAPFVAINCAALPHNLIESEIFGHVKGAFTGAESSRKGAVGEAAGGTLFLDEICEMDINLQAKLLRFLQTGEIRRVGSDWSEHVDVRIICATNKNPLTEVEQKRFREDLYYRLNVLSIELPPLSERGRDVILLAETFLKSYRQEEGKHFSKISPACYEILLNHHWPGNVRELQNVIRKAVVVHDGLALEPHMIDLNARGGTGQSGDINLIKISKSREETTPMESLKTKMLIDIHQPMSCLERSLIEAVIASCDGSVPQASKILKISASTIYRKRGNWTPPQNFEQIAG